MNTAFASAAGVIGFPSHEADRGVFGTNVLSLRTHRQTGRSVMAGESEGLRAELLREKGRLKLLQELAGVSVSNRELRDLVRAIMTTIRSATDSDGICILLKA